MPATVTERALGDVRWLVVRGEREEVFRALGAHASQQIKVVVDRLGDGLRRRIGTNHGADRLQALRRASERAYPDAWAELHEMAAGAQVDARDLALLALRGDVGVGAARGCSDLSWTNGERSLLGHNEDGDAVLDGICSLLTLLIDGEPAVATWWYPGFLPGNTFSLNGHGLVWGIDSVSVTDPATAPGRAFVARGLQSASTLDRAVAYLRSHPSAGGFAFCMGALRSAQLVVAEHAAGRTAVSGASREAPCDWHTNHLRYLPTHLDEPSEDSLRRATILAGVSAPDWPDPGWLVEVLAGRPGPEGVRATGTHVTLCTFAVDLDAATVTLLPNQGHAVTIPAADLLCGELDLQDCVADGVDDGVDDGRKGRRGAVVARGPSHS